MKRAHKSVLAMLVAAAALAPVSVWAGANLKREVEITDVDGFGPFVTGSIYDARASNDSTQYIGCESSTTVGIPTTGWCVAQNRAGRSVSCSTQDPAVIAAIRAVNSISFVRFQIDHLGNCWQVQALNTSRY
jgi:hypothetical protein